MRFKKKEKPVEVHEELTIAQEFLEVPNPNGRKKGRKSFGKVEKAKGRRSSIFGKLSIKNIFKSNQANTKDEDSVCSSSSYPPVPDESLEQQPKLRKSRSKLDIVKGLLQSGARLTRSTSSLLSLSRASSSRDTSVISSDFVLPVINVQDEEDMDTDENLGQEEGVYKGQGAGHTPKSRDIIKSTASGDVYDRLPYIDDSHIESADELEDERSLVTSKVKSSAPSRGTCKSKVLHGTNRVRNSGAGDSPFVSVRMSPRTPKLGTSTGLDVEKYMIRKPPKGDNERWGTPTSVGQKKAQAPLRTQVRTVPSSPIKYRPGAVTKQPNPEQNCNSISQNLKTLNISSEMGTVKDTIPSSARNIDLDTPKGTKVKPKPPPKPKVIPSPRPTKSTPSGTSTIVNKALSSGTSTNGTRVSIAGANAGVARKATTVINGKTNPASNIRTATSTRNGAVASKAKTINSKTQNISPNLVKKNGINGKPPARVTRRPHNIPPPKPPRKTLAKVLQERVTKDEQNQQGAKPEANFAARVQKMRSEFRRESLGSASESNKSNSSLPESPDIFTNDDSFADDAFTGNSKTPKCISSMKPVESLFDTPNTSKPTDYSPLSASAYRRRTIGGVLDSGRKNPPSKETTNSKNTLKSRTKSTTSGENSRSTGGALRRKISNASLQIRRRRSLRELSANDRYNSTLPKDAGHTPRTGRKPKEIYRESDLI